MKETTLQTTQWRCRAECVADAELLKWALRGIAIDMRDEPAWLPDEDPVFLTLYDVGLSFRTECTLTLGMLRWIFSHLTDCHVATESLAEFSEYTAGRTDLEASDFAAPPTDIIQHVENNLDEYCLYLEVLRDRAQESSAVLYEQRLDFEMPQAA
ncbi:hypothetical protein [Cupriavidus sp. TMH.W2]|uniref:hypothetical protein n=1 Tax=Cupriavidus sp. TMH.W2 TaxID=3434465 RepID=UPI003D77431B